LKIVKVISIKNTTKLIEDASRILEHQKEISILKGENFNLFSILKMESKENATHSAFLGELLNPDGSHNMGNSFLKYFLEELESDHIDLESAKVKLEQHVGERNDKEKTGGRVDIYIYDRFDKSICVENKIDAPDQNVQIQRYCNHNIEKNTVYYLTLEGKEPKPKSKGELVSGEDFHLLSYSSNITTWLTKCAKEASNHPILRESIQQYIILIKKLTHQLTDSKMEQEILYLIAKNYSTTKALESNVKKAELNFTRRFLDDVKIELEKKLIIGWKIEVSKSLEEAWSGLTIKHENWPEKVYVKLEGQSKVPWSDSIYGIIGNKKNCNRELLNKELEAIEILKEGFKSNNVWPFYKTILHFGSDESRAELFNEKERMKLVKNLSDKLQNLSKACEEPLQRISKVNSTKEKFDIRNLN